MIQATQSIGSSDKLARATNAGGQIHYNQSRIASFVRANLDVLVCVSCCILLGGLLFGLAYASQVRDNRTSQTLRSQAGVRLATMCVDSEMTTEQETQILQLLMQHDASSWEGFTIRDLVRHLNATTPTYCEAQELSIMGIAMDSKIPSDIPPGPLLSRLRLALQPLELAYQVRSGLVSIETRDSAFARPVIRIYDISPLGNMDHFAMLRNNITTHIDPDNWLTAGGESSLTIQETNSQILLTVSAPTETQLAVEAYLELLVLREIPSLLPMDRGPTRVHSDAPPVGGIGCFSGSIGGI